MMHMKKNILFVAAIITFAACSSNKNMITINSADLTEKEQNLYENNSRFSTASIVGGGAYMAQAEKEAITKKKIEDRERRLKQIPGLSISSTANGFKATAQNEILFQFDSHALNDNAKTMLKELCDVIKEIPETKITIVGHTDNIGEKQYNILLSKNRAAAVGNYLREQGIPDSSISEYGKGYDEPVADNKTEEGRSKNRRVEISFHNEEQ